MTSKNAALLGDKYGVDFNPVVGLCKDDKIVPHLNLNSWILKLFMTHFAPKPIRKSIFYLSKLFDIQSLAPMFSWILISCGLENSESGKKPNNPFKRLLKQHIILCAFQKLQVRQDKEIFWCVQLISDRLNCFIAKGISCLISPFRVGYVNTRAINRKLK